VSTASPTTLLCPPTEHTPLILDRSLICDVRARRDRNGAYVVRRRGNRAGRTRPEARPPLLKGRHFARPEENATQCEACRTRLMVATTI
jgi:hypothetical protein